MYKQFNTIPKTQDAAYVATLAHEIKSLLEML